MKNKVVKLIKKVSEKNEQRCSPIGFYKPKSSKVK